MNIDRAGARPSAVMLQGAASQVDRAIFYSLSLFEVSSHSQFAKRLSVAAAAMCAAPALF
jgi:hypothetical protein